MPEDDRREARPDDSNDALLIGVIGLVGALGLAVGLVDPARTMEPSLGVLLVYFALATHLRERRRGRGARSSVPWRRSK